MKEKTLNEENLLNEISTVDGGCCIHEKENFKGWSEVIKLLCLNHLLPFNLAVAVDST